VNERAVNDVSKVLRIGDVAQRAGTTPRTIRYYEEIGLLPPADERVSGAHRTYAESDVERLTSLLQLKDLLGLSLEELKDLQLAEEARDLRRQEWSEGVSDPRRRRELLESTLGHLERQLDLVKRRQQKIGELESDLGQQLKKIRSLLNELD
jgi:DNA-binding transcriptional MerR regulator